MGRKPRYVVELEREDAIRRAEKAEAALAAREVSVAEGPGKYDDLCTSVRVKTGAVGVCLFVLEGTNGTGFSCQVVTPEIVKLVPELLRAVADEIDRTMKS